MSMHVRRQAINSLFKLAGMGAQVGLWIKLKRVNLLLQSLSKVGSCLQLTLHQNANHVTNSPNTPIQISLKYVFMCLSISLSLHSFIFCAVSLSFALPTESRKNSFTSRTRLREFSENTRKIHPIASMKLCKWIRWRFAKLFFIYCLKCEHVSSHMSAKSLELEMLCFANRT